MLRWLGLALAAIAGIGSIVQAQDVWITPQMPSRHISLPGSNLIISRAQDPQNTVPPEFARTSRKCPPFCITAMTAAPGVVTIGELEVMDFLDRSVSSARGLLIDARLPSFYLGGTLPGAKNVPFTALESSDVNRAALLTSFGGLSTAEGWSFANAKSLVLFSGGPWDGQATRAVQSLIALGYPTEKLLYYRGGMQMWHLLGLTPTYP